MKTIIQIFIALALALATPVQDALAQKLDEEKMQRDVEVSENILGTLIKQQFEKQKMFFPLEIQGSYQPGYGVRFYLPPDYTTPIVFTFPDDDNFMRKGDRTQGNVNYSYEYENKTNDSAPELAGKEGTISLKDKNKEKRKMNADSVRDSYNLKVIDAAKIFLVDYGDMITQLSPNERIMISNQGDKPRQWVGKFFNTSKRSHLAIEILKGDLTLYKQGKITRDQALAKIKVVNTETLDEVEPDLELLSSIFDRLYSPDLSKTFFIQENIYFERLKDYGVIYYMQALSAQQTDYQRYFMPTVGLENIDQATRDKTIKQLYPKFEQELKDNILEYGRTLKSLKEDEVLVFQVKMTRCAGCDIPASLEYNVKSSVLKDFNSGKLEKNAALAKFVIKKGASQ